MSTVASFPVTDITMNLTHIAFGVGYFKKCVSCQQEKNHTQSSSIEMLSQVSHAFLANITTK